MTATPDEITSYCEAWTSAAIREIDPSINFRTIFFDATVLPNWATDGRPHVLAFTSFSLPFKLRHHIEARGLAPDVTDFVVVVDAEQITTEPEAQRISLHELAHRIADEQIATHVYAALSDEFLNLQAFESDTLAARAAAEVVDPQVPPWQHHEAEFIRACNHLAFRARRNFGWWQNVDDIFDARQMHLAPASEYGRHLETELIELADMPLSDILQIDPPESFRRFAENDLARATETWHFLTSPISERYDMSLLEQFRHKRENTIIDLWAEYHAILRRHLKPKAGDADRLEELRVALGINPDAIEVHIQVIEEVDELIAQAAELETIEPEVARLAAERQQLADELRTFRENIHRQDIALKEEEDAMKARRDHLQRLTAPVSGLRTRFAKLLGCEPGPARPNTGLTPRLRQAMNALDLSEEDVSTP